MRLTGRAEGSGAAASWEASIKPALESISLQNVSIRCKTHYGFLSAEELLECIILVKSQESRTGPLKLMVSAEVPFAVALNVAAACVFFGGRLQFSPPRSTRPHFTPDVCLPFPPKSRPWQRSCSSFLQTPPPHLSVWLRVGATGGAWWGPARLIFIMM